MAASQNVDKPKRWQTSTTTHKNDDKSIRRQSKRWQAEMTINLNGDIHFKQTKTVTVKIAPIRYFTWSHQSIRTILNAPVCLKFESFKRLFVKRFWKRGLLLLHYHWSLISFITSWTVVWLLLLMLQLCARLVTTTYGPYDTYAIY